MWDFSDYDTDALIELRDIENRKEDLGFGAPDEDMMYAISCELEKRGIDE